MFRVGELYVRIDYWMLVRVVDIMEDFIVVKEEHSKYRQIWNKGQFQIFFKNPNEVVRLLYS
jgi:hypothetical protein